MPDVTVLIPFRNEKEWLHKLLEAVDLQQYNGGKLEYLFIDGNSDDGGAEFLAKEIERRSLNTVDSDSTSGPERRYTIRVLSNPSRYVSHALNLGIREASSDIIIRWDAHTEYAPDYIEKCVEVLRETGAWNVGGPARTKADGYMQRAIAAAYHSPFSVGGARFHDVEYEGYVDTVTYGCWKKQTLLDLGGFDEELVRNQDDELNLRIIRAGGTIYQSPDIQSWYSPRSSLGALFKQYLQYGYWKVRVIRKHRIPASPRHLVPVLFVLGLILGPFLALLSPVLTTLYAAVLGMYSILLLVFSFTAARKKGWNLFPVLPLVFATYHISYGVGFLLGMLRVLLGKHTTPASDALSGISR